MIKKDGERDRKNANSGCNMLSPFSDIPRITVSFRTIPAVIFYSIPKENRHTCAQAREQMIKTHSERDRKDANSARKLGFHFLTRRPLSAHSCRNCHLLFRFSKKTDRRARTHARTRKKKNRLKRSREGMLISACKMDFLFFNIPLIMVICRPIPTAIVIFYLNSKENKKQMRTKRASWRQW